MDPVKIIKITNSTIDYEIILNNGLIINATNTVYHDYRKWNYHLNCELTSNEKSCLNIKYPPTQIFNFFTDYLSKQKKI